MIALVFGMFFERRSKAISNAGSFRTAIHELSMIKCLVVDIARNQQYIRLGH